MRIAQIYVAPVNPSVLRPSHELKGYDKKLIGKGASARYTVHLGPDAFSYYSTADHTWKLDPGRYIIQIGASSGDIRLEVPLTVE